MMASETRARRLIRRAAIRRGYAVEAIFWHRPGTTPRKRTRDVDGDDDGWTLDGGWEVHLIDQHGCDELVEGYQHELVLEDIERLPIGGYA